ncbi:MAG TPA: hypothetical protein DDY68_03930 [Porphyromonadaceae bacterium]|nr:hypothetical protein [Porphyromonadaceae bacterium]
MAALEKIRSKAVFLIFIIGLAMFAFIIGDFMSSGSIFFRQSQERIISIDGESTDIQTFQEKLEQLTNIYKMQSAQTNLQEEVQESLNQNVFESIVAEKVLSKELEKIGMTITAEELFDLVQGENISPIVQQMPMFVDPKTGVFDKNRLLSFLKQINTEDLEEYNEETREQLSQARDYWLFFEENIRLQRMQDKLFSLLRVALEPNSLSLKNAIAEQDKAYELSYVEKRYNSIPDTSILITEKELKQEYEKTKEKYKTGERRVVNYVALPITPSEADNQETLSQIMKAKEELLSGAKGEDIVNEYSDEPYDGVFVAESSLDANVLSFVKNGQSGDIQGPDFDGETYQLTLIEKKEVRPDSVRVSIITIPAMDEVSTERKADSLLKIGSDLDFDKLVAEYSNGSETKADMGWINEMVALKSVGEEFRDKTFGGKVGDIFKIKTGYTTIIVKLTGKTQPIPMVKLAQVKMKVNPGSNTYNKLYNDLNALCANTNPEEIQKVASERGYEVSTESLSPNDYSIGTIRGNVRPVIRWAFNNKEGERSEVFETQDHFIVLDIVLAQKGDYLPITEVENQLRMSILDRKKAELMLKSLSSKSFSSLEDYAKEWNEDIQVVDSTSFAECFIKGMGIEPFVQGNIWNTSKGYFSQPIQGNDGIYVVRVDEVMDNSQNQSAEMSMQMLDRRNTYLIYSQLLETLKDLSNVKDLRYKFY